MNWGTGGLKVMHRLVSGELNADPLGHQYNQVKDCGLCYNLLFFNIHV